MRNWNPISAIVPEGFLRLRAYLWGIETQWNDSSSGSILGCEPTYEELKPWTFKLQANYVLLVASLPMRNWNYGCSGEAPKHSCGCEPTYEELKLETRYRNLENNGSCEPTYEELKQENEYSTRLPSKLLRAYLWGIETRISSSSSCLAIRCEPTYEELKPRLMSRAESICETVASLPMRNWNSPSISTPSHADALRAYLWGIETDLFPELRLTKFSVASLPMRNWNPVRVSYCLINSCVASLPMRNWNDVKDKLYPKFFGKVASLPMRNWNPIS